MKNEISTLLRKYLLCFMASGLLMQIYAQELTSVAPPVLDSNPLELLSNGAAVTYTHENLSATIHEIIYPRHITEDFCVKSMHLKNASINVKLDLGEDYEYGTNEFMAKVKVRLVAQDFERNSEGDTLLDKIVSLQISPNKPEQLYSITDFNQYMLTDKLQIAIEEYSASEWVQSAVRLQVYFEDEYLSEISQDNQLISGRNVDIVKSPPVFSWETLCPEYPCYQMQILRLYNVGGSSYDGINKINAYVDWSKAMSIDVTDTSGTTENEMAINLMQGTGWYIWRVRPVGNYYEGGFANPQNYGMWSKFLEGGSYYDIDASTNAFYYEQIDEDKNWIYSRTFLEEGHFSEGMVYANGLHLTKQVQKKQQSDTYVNVGQSLYDYSGRPAATSMQGPVKQNNLGYVEGFMTIDGSPYSAVNFDSDANFENPEALSGGYLSDYFSDNNTDVNIPDAQGYPFSRTIFDGSGKQDEIGLPGEVHRIGGGTVDLAGFEENRTTQYYYSSVADGELVKVFGSEAPNHSRLYKIIEKDPNHTLHVTYKDYNDKTIATCLSMQDKDYEVDLINEDEESYYSTEVTKTITAPENLHRIGEGQFAGSFQMNISELTDLTVEYLLPGSYFQDVCGTYCATCDYMVTLFVEGINVDYERREFSESVSPLECNENGEIMVNRLFTDLEPGRYKVGRKIESYTLNSATGESYYDEHIATMNENMDEEISRFDTLKSYLQNNDLEGFYDFLDQLEEDGIVDINLVNEAKAFNPEFFWRIDIELLAEWIKEQRDLGNGLLSANNLIEWLNQNSDDDTNETYFSGSGYTLVSKTALKTQLNSAGKKIVPVTQNLISQTEGGFSVKNMINIIDIAIFNEKNYVIRSACCEIEIPYYSCDYRICEQRANNAFKNLFSEYDYLDFEAYLLDTWGPEAYQYDDPETDDKESYTFGQYFGEYAYDYMGNWMYPANVNNDLVYGSITSFPTFNRYSFSSCNVHAVLEVMVNGVTTTIAEGNVNSAEDMKLLINSSSTSYSAEVFSNDELRIYPVLNNGVAPYGYLDIDFEAEGCSYSLSYGINNIEVHVSESLPYLFGTGSFNKLIENMIDEGGYNCDTAYYTWQMIADAYGNLVTIGTGDPRDLDKTINIVDIFLSTLGKNYKGISDCPYGDCSELGGYGKGYLSNAYEYFQYQEGVRSDCEAYLYENSETSSMDEWLPDDLWEYDNWDLLYRCVNDNWDFSAYKLLNNCETEECYEGISEIYEGNCDTRCELRYESFFSSVKLELENNGLTYGLDFFEIDLMVMADALVEQCKTGCELTPSSTDIGLSIEKKSMQQSMYYTYDLQLPTDGNCLPDYVSVESDPDVQLLALEALNNKLDELLYKLSQHVDETSFSYDQINDWLDEIMGDDNNVSIIPQADITLYTDYRYEFVLKDNQLWLGYMYQNSDGVTWDRSNSYDEVFSYDFTLTYSGLNNTICFKWDDLKVAEENADAGLDLVSCNQYHSLLLYSSLSDQLNQCKERAMDAFSRAYRNKCAKKNNIEDELTATYTLGHKHFTLFYYDRAGNLVKTVAPKGVNVQKNYMTREKQQEHQFETTYEYNTLGQLLSKNTPDGGQTQLKYTSSGLLRFSQTAQQKEDEEFYYIRYDELGRIIETGIKEGNAVVNWSILDQFTDNMGVPENGTQISITVYSVAHPNINYIDGTEQNNLRNRISYIYSDEDGDKTTNNDQVITVFSYDPHGNVKWMAQRIPGMQSEEGAFDNVSYMAYEYDLITGNVKEIKLNDDKNRVDRFYHRYSYDEDNRLVKVETSRDYYIWDTDAKYEYYAYGPLKRVALGEDKIQGIDYTYTLLGWLKGINHPSLEQSKDPGRDGSATASINQNYASDAFGMALGYFEGDFNRADSYFNTQNTASNLQVPDNELYNGNIASWSYNSHEVDNEELWLEEYQKQNNFRYDELGRLTKSIFSYYDGSNWNVETDYYSTYSYDGNGNLSKLLRKQRSENNANMDNLTYNYLENTNKLSHIDDGVWKDRFDGDIDDQNSLNYAYDKDGRLIKDDAENINNISWNRWNKVEKVSKSNEINTNISFQYDGFGNRVVKTVNAGGLISNTYYVRDANGRLIARYKKVENSINLNGTDNGVLRFVEAPVYGADRLGVLNVDTAVTAEASDSKFTRILGEKQYELKDHLGNVRVVTSDIKNTQLDANNEIAWHYADILAENNYYPFGMQMPGMSYQSSDYLYGFNGMEKDDELKGAGNSYDFGARLYDPRVGRWLSTDALEMKFASKSPFMFASNDPISRIDPDGNEDKPVEVMPDLQNGGFIEKESFINTGSVAGEFEIVWGGEVVEPGSKELPDNFMADYVPSGENGLPAVGSNEWFNMTTLTPDPYNSPGMYEEGSTLYNERAAYNAETQARQEVHESLTSANIGGTIGFLGARNRGLSTEQQNEAINVGNLLLDAVEMGTLSSSTNPDMEFWIGDVDRPSTTTSDLLLSGNRWNRFQQMHSFQNPTEASQAYNTIHPEKALENMAK